MPPKKGKQDVKAREKAVEDKTFGMKNKKGAKGQQKIQQVKQSMEATAARAQGLYSADDLPGKDVAAVHETPDTLQKIRLSLVPVQPESVKNRGSKHSKPSTDRQSSAFNDIKLFKNERGPSKKELKEMQKAQEDEMLALFNAVPKKDDGKANQKDEELDPDTGPTFTDITQEIEYQRANVVAKTKITDEVFQAWRKKKLATRRAMEEEGRKERLRKGLLTGREIFMESKSAIQDDDTAAGDDDMLREVDEELEIAKMNAQAVEEQRRARMEAGLDPDGSEDPSATAGPSTSAAGPSRMVTGTGVELSADDAALLEDDDDDVDLEELEAQLHASTVGT